MLGRVPGNYGDAAGKSAGNTKKEDPMTFFARRFLDPGDPGGDKGGGDEKKFSQADVDKILKERLEREKAKQAESEKKAEEAAGRVTALEKELADAKKAGESVAEIQKKLDEATGKAKALETAALKAAALKKAGLSDDWAPYLTGTTAEEMDAAAAQVAKLANAAPKGDTGNPGNPPKTTPTALTMDDVAKMTPAEINARWEEVQKVAAS